MEPLVFEPYLRPQIWGGRALKDLFGKNLPDDGPYGESWELSAHPLHVSRVADGPFRGQTLTELFSERRMEVFGAAAARKDQFPLLVKLLDCRELLSVQVHPDDRTAQELLGEPNGKTEAWVVLHVEPTGRIYAGLREGTTREILEKHLDAGTVQECLVSMKPRPGDCVFIPAGLVHAVGGGVVMAEVQQSSDATFRLFDWNRVDPTTGRPRSLHREQSLRSIRFDLRPGRTAPTAHPATPPGVVGETLARCPYFRLERYGFLTDSLIPGYLPINPGQLSIWIVLSGSATLEGSGNSRIFHAGETVLIPSIAGPFTWRGTLAAEGAPEGSAVSLLRVTIPPA